MNAWTSNFAASNSNERVSSLYSLAYLMYLYDLGPQTPRRLTYHQPVKRLPRVTSDLQYANHVI